MFLFTGAAAPPHRHPFPTRRSSDLAHPARKADLKVRLYDRWMATHEKNPTFDFVPFDSSRPSWLKKENRRGYIRSEEHTSELQSPCNLVCRLLLEKENNKPNSVKRR